MDRVIVLEEQAFVGYWRRDRDQIFEVFGVRDYVRRDKTKSKVLVWRARCAACGEYFSFSTGLTIWNWRRRCDSCKAPGKPAFGRWSKGKDNRSDAELARVSVEEPGEPAMKACMELQRRKRAKMRSLKWYLANGTQEERANAERELKKLRVPVRRMNAKGRREPKEVSIFD